MPTRSYLSRYFGEKGLLKQTLPGFAVREQQQTIAAGIDAALTQRGGIALVEAGTGVGKTLAYLIPAFQRAKPGCRIVISTHTLALQAQLAEKDVPFVRSIWKSPPDAAVVKGRGNYLCLQDMDAARMDLWTVGDPEFAKVAAWSRTSERGDVAELDFTYPGWADIRANPDTCKKQECRFFDRCFITGCDGRPKKRQSSWSITLFSSATSPSGAAANRTPNCCRITISSFSTRPTT